MRRALSLVAAVMVVWVFLPPVAVTARAASASSAFSATKTVTRDHLISGVTTTVDSRTISLSVSATQDLRGLQQVDVAWTGARPTGGAVSDVNNGSLGVALEYPMVLLECRGIDSPSAPAGSQLDPTTCWSAYMGRRALTDNPNFTGHTAFPPWRLDAYASADQRGPVVGLPTDPNAVLAGSNPPTTAGAALAGCNNRQPIEYWLPFLAANGDVFYPGGGVGSGEACPGFPQPPEALGTAPEATLTFPSNETYAETGLDGRGRARFDIFTANENASLGCSDTVPCSLVAIPIMGIGCDVAAAGLPSEDVPPTSTAAQAEATCELSGRRQPGVPNSEPDLAVSGRLWWAASNWRNRITVPLGFAPVKDACSLTGGGQAEVDIYGAEMMTEATAQWNPHFCLDPSLFILKHVATPEPTARNILAKGNTVAAYSSYDPPGTYGSPVVNAPVAITGFAISFAIDDDAGNEVTSLRLNARLLAKLLTQSYVDDPTNFAPQDPAISHNPTNIIGDPEFDTLNPEISAPTPNPITGWGNRNVGYKSGYEAASVLYSLSSDSDVMHALTSYIINDPEARAWLNGTPDPWGMVVNPHYNQSVPAPEISIPTQSWLLLDTARTTAGQTGGTISLTPFGPCTDLIASPYLGLVAAPASQMLRIAQAVEFAWPLSTTNCIVIDNPNSSGVLPQKVARDPRQPPGNRFVLGVTSLGEADRFGLRTASLQTSAASAVPGQFTPPDQRTFVGPNNASLRAATELLTPDAASQTWQLPSNLETLPAAAGAYPGTMVVNAEIPTTGLSSTDATNLAKFLRFAAGPGQQPGTGIGQLPAGYLPMTSADGAGALVAYTNAAADAVAAQSGNARPVVPGTAPSPAASTPGTTGASHPGTGPGPGVVTSPSSTSTTETTSQGSASGGPGSLTAVGPGLSKISGGGGPVPPPVAAGDNGPGGILGKTVAILSAAGSLLRWLLLIALGALLAAAVFYFLATRRAGGPLNFKGFVELLSAFVAGLFGRLVELLRPQR